MPVTYLRTSISKPYVAMRYKAKKKGDEDKISQSLQKLLMEDLTLNSVNDSENGQTVLYGIGDMQLEVVASELLEKYKVKLCDDLLKNTREGFETKLLQGSVLGESLK